LNDYSFFSAPQLKRDPLGSSMDVQSLASTQKPSFKEGRQSMRSHQWISAWIRKGMVVALVLASSGALMAFVHEDSSSRGAAQTRARIAATIFAYDGQDFVRIKTTLVTEQGRSAVNTKLDHDTPAYRALVQKRSYTGDVTIFGRKYEANYAPLTGDDGRLTGALFVAVPK